ncbi:hypothetical protein AIZ15_24665, partial [Salmonella enterica subsp. enterica serovar Typhimurium]
LQHSNQFRSAVHRHRLQSGSHLLTQYRKSDRTFIPLWLCGSSQLRGEIKKAAEWQPQMEYVYKWRF